MKQKRRFQSLIAFMGIALMAYIQCCMVYAVVWAGFNGFGGIWMDYTESGEKITSGILVFWFFLLLLLLVLKMAGHYKRKKTIKYYLLDICLWLLGIGAGILIFLFFRQPREMIMNGMVNVIRMTGWLEYPIP